MTNPVDRDSFVRVVNREQDSVVTDPQAVALHVRQFFHLGMTGLDR